MTRVVNSETLAVYQQQVEVELRKILVFWTRYAVDLENGGFIGRMNSAGQVVARADKGLVLNARILWTFAAASRFYSNQIHALAYTEAAHRAYEYLRQYFRDHLHGGVYWSVKADGSPANRRKQIYGQAFTLYGLSEYYKMTQNPDALSWAIELYQLIEQYSLDRQHGGYFEALSQDWSPLDDLRLSEKDRNDPKSMNTHLHVVEAYATLYQVWPDPALRSSIVQLLEVFVRHIVDPQTKHLRLFFDAAWHPQSRAISYGHDIEAAWLLLEVAEIIDDAALVRQFESLALDMAQAASEGLNPDGSLNHEYDPESGHTDRHREWWVSAEGMVGYLNAYQVAKQAQYLERSMGLWEFAQQYLIDHQHGEWWWGVHEDLSPMLQDDKIGFWKCPYHTVRACIETIQRLRTLIHLAKR